MLTLSWIEQTPIKIDFWLTNFMKKSFLDRGIKSWTQQADCLDKLQSGTIKKDCEIQRGLRFGCKQGQNFKWILSKKLFYFSATEQNCSSNAHTFIRDIHCLAMLSEVCFFLQEQFSHSFATAALGSKQVWCTACYSDAVSHLSGFCHLPGCLPN